MYRQLAKRCIRETPPKKPSPIVKIRRKKKHSTSNKRIKKMTPSSSSAPLQTIVLVYLALIYDQLSWRTLIEATDHDLCLQPPPCSTTVSTKEGGCNHPRSASSAKPDQCTCVRRPANQPHPGDRSHELHGSSQSIHPEDRRLHQPAK